MGAAGLTMRELADLLDPPVTVEQVFHIVRAVGLEPCGWRRSGRRGRPAALYNAAAVMEAHSLLTPLMMREQGRVADLKPVRAAGVSLRCYGTCGNRTCLVPANRSTSSRRSRTSSR